MRNGILVVAVVVGLVTTVALAAPPVLPPGVRQVKDVAYVPDGDAAQKLDLYLPENGGEAPWPLIVWVHGGGWSGGSKAGCPAIGFVRRGYAVASVEYRFSQKAAFPAQIQDCQAAIRWLRAHATEYGIDGRHIGVWGESAGGHLVLLFGLAGGTDAFGKIGGNDEQSDRVQAVVDYYGPTDFATVREQAASDRRVSNTYHFNHGDPYSGLIGVPLGSDTAKEEAVSPVRYVGADNPPLLILHGTKDPLVPYAQSEELVAAMKGVNAKEVLLQTFPGAGHGGGPFSQPAVMDLLRAFFDKHVAGKDVEVTLIPDSKLAAPTTSSAPRP